MAMEAGHIIFLALVFFFLVPAVVGTGCDVIWAIVWDYDLNVSCGNALYVLGYAFGLVEFGVTLFRGRK